MHRLDLETLYLRHLEKLRELGHPDKKPLVYFQRLFALILLHIKIFLFEVKKKVNVANARNVFSLK